MITREVWQEDLQRRIKSSLPALNRAGITSAYYIIAATAILPVLVAGAGWPLALGTMVGSIGANLISNVLQGAKDEVEIAQKLQNLPSNDPALEIIELLLEKLDAFNVVRQAWPESDWIRLERLLDEKLSRFNTSTSREPTAYAPIVRETITHAQVRQIALEHMTNLWWANTTLGKANVSLNFVPTVLYKAGCFAFVQVNRANPQNSQETITFKEATDPFPIRLIFFREEDVQHGHPLLQDKLYKSINGLLIQNEIDWPENSFATWGYKVFARPVRNPYSPSSSDGIRKAEQNIGFWFGGKRQYDTKPSTLMIQKGKIIDEARLAVEEILERKYDSISGKTLLRARFSDEELDFAQYPFYFYEMTVPGFARVVIDGLTGDVRYSCLKPNWKAKVFYSVTTFLLGLAILLLLGAAVLVIYYLWIR